MNKTNNIPSYLTQIKDAPEGYHWEYRGKAWSAENVMYAIHRVEDGYDWIYGSIMVKGQANGNSNYYYVELVKNSDLSLDQHVRNADKLLNSGHPLVDNPDMYNKMSGYSSDSKIRKFNYVSIRYKGDGKAPAVVSNFINRNNRQFCVTLSDGESYVPYELLMVKPKKEFVEVELNSRYTAEVYKDKIVVGCQTFPTSILDKLADALEEIEKQ